MAFKLVIVVLLVLVVVSLFQALTSRGERSMGKPGFFTLRGVLALFSNPKAVLAAWIHILAFDLMVGLYIQQQGALQQGAAGLLLSGRKRVHILNYSGRDVKAQAARSSLHLPRENWSACNRDVGFQKEMCQSNDKKIKK